MTDLEKAKNREIPSPFGKAEYVVPGTPASVQSKKAARDACLAIIKSLFKNTEYLLTGEIMLNVTWCGYCQKKVDLKLTQRRILIIA
ncbi:hypothetical protein Q4488_03585 [Amphritea sp. 1_MG-2023]|uniref:hypothetical protein n=1 Tax=Amphritea sp. 1_MG-2023 TaxID=3062670 RepID=UPI0026E1B9DE|nr:hypothetical protein [Amphritea sp. 1_MG-2023]MDO6562458.1 hypothetical protein [Amphritea sp. 1_MG-2023]